jgi:hypothetical protein
MPVFGANLAQGATLLPHKRPFRVWDLPCLKAQLLCFTQTFHSDPTHRAIPLGAWGDIGHARLRLDSSARVFQLGYWDAQRILFEGGGACLLATKYHSPICNLGIYLLAHLLV